MWVTDVLMSAMMLLCTGRIRYFQLPTALYLERLEQVNFDAFHPSLQLKTWTLPWRVWTGYYSGRF